MNLIKLLQLAACCAILPMATIRNEAGGAARDEVATITISAAGDTTLGGDTRWAGYHAFQRIYRENDGDLSYFFRNVAHIFAASDLSIVNFEGTLTHAEEHLDNQFVFRGDPHLASILRYGNIDAVTIANNHTGDFLARGLLDTRQALTDHGIVYFGNEFNRILEVNGINVGLFGFSVWAPGAWNENRIRAAIDDLNARGAQLIIAYFHWGTENTNHINDTQRTMGRFTIDAGAHLVLGSHPHVIQGIEIYNGRNIVYSLANFCFGGNANPVDQDTFIFQQTFTFVGGVLQQDNNTNLIPAFISSTRRYNNFQPTVAEDEDAMRILRRLELYSSWVNQ